METDKVEVEVDELTWTTTHVDTDTGEVVLDIVHPAQGTVELRGEPEEIERVIVDADRDQNRARQAEPENQPVHDQWDIPPLTREQAEELGIDES